MIATVCVSGLTSSNVIASQNQALAAATDSDSQTNRPRLPVGRPRLAVPTASGLPQDNSRYDDGLNIYTQCSVNSCHPKGAKRRCPLPYYLLFIYYVKSYSKYNTKKLKKTHIKLKIKNDSTQHMTVYSSVLTLTTFRHH